MRIKPLCFAFVAVILTSGVLVWANVRTNIIISESPSRFGMPWAIRIGWWRGWPFHYYSSSFTVGRDEMPALVSTDAGQRELANWATRHGRDELAMWRDWAVAVALVAGSGAASYRLGEVMNREEFEESDANSSRSKSN